MWYIWQFLYKDAVCNVICVSVVLWLDWSSSTHSLSVLTLPRWSTISLKSHTAHLDMHRLVFLTDFQNHFVSLNSHVLIHLLIHLSTHLCRHHHSHLPLRQILPTSVDVWYPLDCLHRSFYRIGLTMLISLFLVHFLFKLFCLIPCSRLLWLLVSIISYDTAVIVKVLKLIGIDTRIVTLNLGPSSTSLRPSNVRD